MKGILFLFSFLFSISIVAQIQGDGGMPFSQLNQLENEVQRLTFEKPDIKKLQDEDLENDAKGIGAWRFGFNNQTNITMDNSGTWTHLENGGNLWQLEVECLSALSINFTLENVRIEEGNELYFSTLGGDFVLGKFTDKHVYNGNLGTELIPGGLVLVEYYVAPQNNWTNASLNIVKVTHGYRTASDFSKAFGNAGACNMNVNCPDGAEWENQKRSAVMLVNSGGNGFCSGALVNNTQNDGKPYILTANHCYSNPANWVFRFNYEGDDCSNPAVEPTDFESLSGAVLRSRRLGSDFCLVEITGGLEMGTIPMSFNAYFSGWDNTGAQPTRSVTIHHPKGDIKKISFDDDPSVATQSTIGGVLSDPDGVWKMQWDRETTTESASSGSPLFDQNHRIIGQLWGGQASCTNQDGNDFYGRFFSSWNPIGSNQTNQLKYWLDPTDLGASVIDGYDPSEGVVTLDGALILPTDVSGTICDETITPKVTLVNLGSTTLTSASIDYGFDGSTTLNYVWNGNLDQYESVIITLPNATVSEGNHDFGAVIGLVNGVADPVAMNNELESSFYTVIGGETLTLNLELDCYGSEIHWFLTNEDEQILFQSPEYINNTEGSYSYDFCLAEECYTFTITDQYGDGMTGCTSGNGSYEIVDANDNIYAELASEDADFDYELVTPICIGSASVNELATNMFQLFPNPAHEKINIESEELIDRIEIVSLDGKLLFEQETNLVKNKELNVSNLYSGIYIVRIEFNNGSSASQRLVIGN